MLPDYLSLLFNLFSQLHFLNYVTSLSGLGEVILGVKKKNIYIYIYIYISIHLGDCCLEVQYVTIIFAHGPLCHVTDHASMAAEIE